PPGAVARARMALRADIGSLLKWCGCACCDGLAVNGTLTPKAYGRELPLLAVRVKGAGPGGRPWDYRAQAQGDLDRFGRRDRPGPAGSLDLTHHLLHGRQGLPGLGELLECAALEFDVVLQQAGVVARHLLVLLLPGGQHPGTPGRCGLPDDDDQQHEHAAGAERRAPDSRRITRGAVHQLLLHCASSSSWVPPVVGALLPGRRGGAGVGDSSVRGSPDRAPPAVSSGAPSPARRGRRTAAGVP